MKRLMVMVCALLCCSAVSASEELDRGLASHEAADYPSAAMHYKAAVQLEPDSLQAQYNLGVVLGHQNRHREAIPHYEAAVQIKPDFTGALNNLGLLLRYFTAEDDRARGLLDRALQLDPGNWDVLGHNSMIMENQRDKMAAPSAAMDELVSTYHKGAEEALFARFQRNQNPPDCGTARYLVYHDDSKDIGLGFSFKYVLQFAMWALVENRVLVEAPSVNAAWRWNWCQQPPYSWQCFFHPWSRSTAPPPPRPPAPPPPSLTPPPPFPSLAPSPTRDTDARGRCEAGAAQGMRIIANSSSSSAGGAGAGAEAGTEAGSPLRLDQLVEWAREDTLDERVVLANMSTFNMQVDATHTHNPKFLQLLVEHTLTNTHSKHPEPLPTPSHPFPPLPTPCNPFQPLHTQHYWLMFGASGIDWSLSSGRVWWMAQAQRFLMRPLGWLQSAADGFRRTHSLDREPFMLLHLRQGNNPYIKEPKAYLPYVQAMVHATGCNHLFLQVRAPPPPRTLPPPGASTASCFLLPASCFLLPASCFLLPASCFWFLVPAVFWFLGSVSCSAVGAPPPRRAPRPSSAFFRA
jgi:hypothetical protein